MVLQQLLTIASVLAVFVTVLFVLSIIVKRNDIADVAWGVGISLVAAVSYLVQTEENVLLTILLVLIVLWGVRLSARIFLRNLKKSEDYRYKKWRDDWGSWFYIRSYFQVYLLQGFLMIVVGYSAIHTSVYGVGSTLSIFTILGILIWCVGYFFEVMGDLQLDRFISSKPEAGTVLSTGLWKYTRHPNYFGEVTMWWGLWLIVAPLPLSYLALVSPLTITFLILKVSGIPMLEKKFAGNVQFEAYKKRTSAFFPLPPKNN